jgi:penicillin-binding protein activator
MTLRNPMDIPTGRGTPVRSVIVFVLLALFGSVVTVVGTAGCAGRTVSRVPADTTVDLSGRWNDVDSRQVSTGMIQDALNSSWITEWMNQRNGKKPAVIVGLVRNKTDEHIPVGTFVSDIERAMVNSGRVDVVATAAERSELRSERQDQWQNATEETVKQMGRELGADFMLGGSIESIQDRDGGERVLFYQIDLSLLNIESNQKVWMGQEKIKKVVRQGQFRP